MGAFRSVAKRFPKTVWMCANRDRLMARNWTTPVAGQIAAFV